MKDNDLENLFAALIPGGIEAQEARGQSSFVASETIPWNIRNLIDVSMYSVKDKHIKQMTDILKTIGFEFDSLEKVDDLFIDCKLPEGWKKERTDHSMWSNLLDDKGRIRATIFYKAAFYDRDSFMNMEPFFNISYTPVGGYSEGMKDYDNDMKKPFVSTVKNKNGDVVFTLEPSKYDYNSQGKEYKKCKEWLKKNYPDHENVLAYWD